MTLFFVCLQGSLTAIKVFGFVSRRVSSHFKPGRPADCYSDINVNERTPALAIETVITLSGQREVGFPMPLGPPPPYEEDIKDLPPYEEAIKDLPPRYTEISAPPINPYSTQV